MATIELRGIRKSFGDSVALHQLDLEIPDGQLTVLVGPSGCGKSTLLRLIAGLEDPDQGQIFIDGRAVNAVPPVRRNLAMVFQSYALYPHMTVAENLAFPLRMARRPRAEIRAKVNNVAAALALEALLERKPKALSGGQQQRVAIGRAVIRDPVAYLFDEPLSNLDAQLRVAMRDEIVRLKERLGTTMLYVTHDQVEAMTLADRVVLLDRGRVAQVGPPLELYHRPRSRFVAAFIGSPQMNFLSVRIIALRDRMAEIELQDGRAVSVPVSRSDLEVGARASLGVRPEHLSLQRGGEADEAAVAAEVLRMEALGPQTHIHLQTAAGELLAVQSGESDLRAGESILVSLPERACHLFPDESR